MSCSIMLGERNPFEWSIQSTHKGYYIARVPHLLTGLASRNTLLMGIILDIIGVYIACCASLISSTGSRAAQERRPVAGIHYDQKVLFIVNTLGGCTSQPLFGLQSAIYM
eukprot:scaffold136589_cov17-Prasinocladus_malaysianus.AAC.1